MPKDILSQIKKDHQYTIKIKPAIKYEKQNVFFEGFAAVRLDNKWGFIDCNGVEVIPCQYDLVLYFCDGITAAKSQGKWGYIDTQGNQLTEFKYDSAGVFGADMYGIVKLNGKSGIMNRHFQEIAPMVYDEIWFMFEEQSDNIDMARGLKDGQWSDISLDVSF